MELIRQIHNKILLEIGLPVIDLFQGTKSHYYYHQIQKMNNWPKVEIESWQDNKIQELILHFYNNTIYYKNLLDGLKIDPREIRTREDLIKIPSINKKIIHQNYNELIPKNFKEIPHKKATTGGSSGDPLKYLLDLESWSYTTVAKIYAWQTTGYLYGEKFATLGSSSLFPEKTSLKYLIYHFFKGSLRLSAMNLSDETLEDYAKILEKKKIKYLYGYAAALYLFAKFLNGKGVKLKNVKGCFPSSEVLTDEYRSEIEKAFGFVMDCYGARDGGINAYEIHRGFYNIGYNSLLEIKNDENKGSILVTDLLNKAFPFIRYEIGDEVELEENSDNIYNGQVIKSILGRTPDIIRLGNGKTLTGVGFQVMFGRFNVSEYRIKKGGDLLINVEIIPKENFSTEEEKLITATLKRHAGEECQINIIRRDKFEKKANGKINSFMT